MPAVTSPHFVMLDRSDPNGPRWKLLTVLAERPADLDPMGVVGIDEWGSTIHWTTVTLNRMVTIRSAAPTTVWLVLFPDSD